MRELERRRAEAEGRTPPRDPADPEAPAGDGDRPGDRGDARRQPGDRPAGDTPDEGATAGVRRAHPDPPPLAGRAPRAPRPAARPARPARSSPWAAPTTAPVADHRGRSCGGWGSSSPSSWSPSSSSLPARGIDLWTDAIWYQSVGFDSVFWTRLGAQVGLFLGALVVALVVLLVNLWLAGRLAPPPDPEKPGRLRQVADRLTEAQRQAERTARMAGGPGRPVGGPFPGRARADEFAGPSTWTTSPTSCRSRGGSSPAVAVLLALGVAGAVSGAWDTLLLWINRVPFSPDRQRSPTRSSGATSASSCSTCRSSASSSRCSTGCCSRRSLVAGARYLRAGHRGRRGVRHPRPRPPRDPRRAVPAVGRLRLPARQVRARVQHGRASPRASPSPTRTPGSWPTTCSRSCPALAAALLVAGAFTRWMWPLGLDRHRLVRHLARARPALPGGHPAAHRRSQHSTPRRSRTSRTTSR